MTPEGYQLGPKALHQIFAGSIFNTVCKLYGLLGKLNFAYAFIPGYEKLVKSLVLLMLKEYGGV